MPGRHPRRGRRHQPLHRQLPRVRPRSTPATPRARRRRARPLGIDALDRVLPQSALQGGSQNLLRGGERPRASPTCGSTSTPTAAWRGCACYGEVRAGLPPLVARGGGSSTSAAIENGGLVARRQRHALRRQGQPDHARPRRRTWATAGRRSGAAGPGTTGSSSRLGAPGHDRASRGRHQPLQGQLPRHALPRGLHAAGREPRGPPGRRARPGGSSCPRTKLQAAPPPLLQGAARANGPFTHVRLRIFPDGGVAASGVHGTRCSASTALTGATRPRRGAAALLRRVALGRRRWPRGGRSRTRTRCSPRPTRSWAGLGPEDWREAFAAPPAHRRQGGAARALRGHARTGPAASRRASPARPRTCCDALADGNRDYEARFGHIFIVCATGQVGRRDARRSCASALANDPEAELRIAAAEQAKITRIRLEKLLASDEPDHDPRPRHRRRAARPPASASSSRLAARWRGSAPLARGTTDADGRVGDLLPEGEPATRAPTASRSIPRAISARAGYAASTRRVRPLRDPRARAALPRAPPAEPLRILDLSRELAWISTDHSFPNICRAEHAQAVKRSARAFHHGTLTV